MSRKQRAASDWSGAWQVVAFTAGKKAAPGSRCPFRKPDEAAAWLRGRAFADAHSRGLRPLDTARRLP